MEIKVSEVIFREDLYPRIETNHRTGMEVSYAVMCPDVCPPALASLSAGFIMDGIFYPSGTVASHFFLKQRELRPLQKKQKPDVYFIQSEKGGPVKIGMAVNVQGRLSGLQTAHPHKLKLIGVIANGGRHTEKMLHEQLSDYRLNGEWFEWSDKLEELLNG